LAAWGEARVMFENKERKPNEHRFGKLELVDKEIFFISFNTRDN
jgi:hypothetical protein